MNIFKNRNSRKTIILGIIVIMLSTGIFGVINNIQYRKYLKIVNAKIDNIISEVIEKYPDITEEERQGILACFAHQRLKIGQYISMQLV